MRLSFPHLVSVAAHVAEVWVATEIGALSSGRCMHHCLLPLMCFLLSEIWLSHILKTEPIPSLWQLKVDIDMISFWRKRHIWLLLKFCHENIWNRWNADTPEVAVKIQIIKEPQIAIEMEVNKCKCEHWMKCQFKSVRWSHENICIVSLKRKRWKQMEIQLKNKKYFKCQLTCKKWNQRKSMWWKTLEISFQVEVNDWWN